MNVTHHTTESRSRYREILTCAMTGSVGILLLDALVIRFGVYYYSDDVNVLYPVAIHSLTGKVGNPTRPLEYLIVLAANNVYLPLWLGASLVCVVGATIMSALACERLLERQLPKAGWWALGIANPLFFLLVSQPDLVSQALSNLLFAGAMLGFISELYLLRRRVPSDAVAICLNLISAVLFFTKETAVAAAVVIPAVTTILRFKARRLSPIFLFSLLLPVAAAAGWFWLKLEYPLMLPTEPGRYSLKINPVMWVQHLVVTVAFSITPLPTSFLEFELLRELWVAVAVASVCLFGWILLDQSRRRPRIVVPLIVVAASCAPMILIHASEYYSTMIAPLLVSMVCLVTIPKMRRITLVYAVMLYGASLGNGIIYCLGADFDLLGLQRLGYSIYGRQYQFYPICPIGTTAHVGWDGTAAGELPYGPPDIRGRITCIR